MNPSPRWRPRRVYYILCFLLILTPGASRAQSDGAANAAMTKGPAQARVTIVEFSDYQ